MSFYRALKFTLHWEGGYTNDRVDPGGATNYGITQAIYSDWLRTNQLPWNAVAEIDHLQVFCVYRDYYWNVVPIVHELKSPLQVALFDTIVQFGYRGCVLFLQEAIGVGVDGVVGPRTLEALRLKNGKSTAQLICDGRLAYRSVRCREDPSQSRFLDGWQRRDRALLTLISGL